MWTYVVYMRFWHKKAFGAHHKSRSSSFRGSPPERVTFVFLNTQFVNQSDLTTQIAEQLCKVIAFTQGHSLHARLSIKFYSHNVRFLCILAKKRWKWLKWHVMIHSVRVCTGRIIKTKTNLCFAPPQKLRNVVCLVPRPLSHCTRDREEVAGTPKEMASPAPGWLLHWLWGQLALRTT